LAADAGLSVKAFRRRCRISYSKVAEFQARGVVHMHVPIRLDGPDGPDGAASDVPVETGELEDAVRAAASSVQVDSAPLRDGTTYRLRWGNQVGCRSVSGDADREGSPTRREVHPERVASYLAKYLTKATEDFGLPTKVRSAGHARSVGASPHAVRIIEKALWLAGQGEPYARLRECLATLGYRGHPITKSRAYSVTFGQLRRARRIGRRNPGLDPAADIRELVDDDLDVPEGFELVSSWVYLGRGYLDLDQAASAVMSAALSRTRTIRRHTPAASRQPAIQGRPAGRQGRSAAESDGHEVPLTG
jgi:hypothetical protein